MFVRLTAGLGALLFLSGCGIHTVPFRDEHGATIRGSVATMTDVTVGGVTQRSCTPRDSP